MSCFYVQSQDVTKDRAILRGEEAHHCLRVRRHKKGDLIEAVDGAGLGYQVRIERVEAEELAGKIVAVRPEWGEPKHKITLAQSLIKGGWIRLDRGEDYGAWCAPDRTNADGTDRAPHGASGQGAAMGKDRAVGDETDETLPTASDRTRFVV